MTIQRWLTMVNVMTVMFMVIVVADVVLNTFAVAVVETNDVDGVFGVVAAIVVVIGRGEGETGFAMRHGQRHFESDVFSPGRTTEASQQ